MNWMLTDASANWLRQQMKTGTVAVPATPLQPRKARPDVPPGAVSSEGPHPFKVRWVDRKADPAHQITAYRAWEIYIPAGAVTLTFDIALEEGSEEDWYQIQGWEDTEGEEWFEVTVHLKYFCFRTDREEAWSDSRPVVVATARTAESETYYQDRAGDILSPHCAYVSVVYPEDSGGSSEEEPTRRVMQSLKTPLTIEHRFPATLEMYWKWEPDTFPAVFTPFIPGLSREAPICGGALEETDITVYDDDSNHSVYYLIDCTGQAPVPSIVEEEPEEMRGKLSIRIYVQRRGYIIADFRADLNRAVYYP